MNTTNQMEAVEFESNSCEQVAQLSVEELQLIAGGECVVNSY